MLKKTSIEKLTALLALPASGQEQDWELELADATRIGEFLLAYDRAGLSPDDKVALMALLLASVDRYLGANERPPDEWPKVAELLRKDQVLHKGTAGYWACEDDDEEEHWFRLTPHLRALWPLI